MPDMAVRGTTVRRARRALLLTAWAASAACAQLRSDTTVCPEYRELRCATAPECSMDAQRGCRVCNCGPPPAAADRTGQLPSGVPPDRRTPQ